MQYDDSLALTGALHRFNKSQVCSGASAGSTANSTGLIDAVWGLFRINSGLQGPPRCRVHYDASDNLTGILPNGNGNVQLGMTVCLMRAIWSSGKKD